MKYLLLLTLSCLFIFSCSQDNALSSDEYPQKWVLVKMTGSMDSSETTDEDMAWQEYYLLYEDNSFLKSREQNGEKTQANGTYQIIHKSSGKYLVLTYKNEHNIIGSCSSQSEENLVLESKNKIISTWQSCDGPSLEYKRVE